MLMCFFVLFNSFSQAFSLFSLLSVQFPTDDLGNVHHHQQHQHVGAAVMLRLHHNARNGIANGNGNGNNNTRSETKTGTCADTITAVTVTNNRHNNKGQYLDSLSTIWRVVLSYLTWEQLHEIAALVSHDVYNLSRLCWKVDAVPAKQWINVLDDTQFGTSDCGFPCTASATPRWDDTAHEDPANVIDGNPTTWWSSKQLDGVTLELIFQERVIPLRVLTIFWGDDNGRIRPCSGSYEVQILVPRRRHKWWSTKRWTTIHQVSENGLTLPQGFQQWPEVIGTTTTFVVLPVETACSGIRVVFTKRQRHWNNHAVVGIEGWCRARVGDCC
jgi:hypothetical protein